MNTRTQILLIWVPPKDWTGRSGDFRSHHWHLIVDGNVAYHLTHNVGKFWNKSRKVRAPVPSRGFEPGWIGSTTKNLINWSMISLLLFSFCWRSFFNLAPLSAQPAQHHHSTQPIPFICLVLCGPPSGLTQAQHSPAAVLDCSGQIPFHD